VFGSYFVQVDISRAVAANYGNGQRKLTGKACIKALQRMD
jgi:hypothetical protein